MTVVEKFWPKIDSNGIANNRIELFIGMNSLRGGAVVEALPGKLSNFIVICGVAAANLKTFQSDKNPFSPNFCVAY